MGGGGAFPIKLKGNVMEKKSLGVTFLGKVSELRSLLSFILFIIS